MKALSSSARRGATIHDVAGRAGVSIATVSRVVRGTARVADNTRTKVLQAVQELAFVPSRSAQSLAEGRHAADGVVLPDLSGPYYAEVLLGYEETAGELGHSVLIRSTRARTSTRELVLDLAARVDGLVILGYGVPDEVIREVATGTPTVLLAREQVDGLDTVRVQNTQSATQLGLHLASHGHRSCWFLGDPEHSRDVAERLDGLRAAATMSVHVIPCRLEEAAGERAVASALTGAERPDVLVCANDEVALGAMFACKRRGLRVPDDIAVTGWDDVMAARHVEPGLTTVRQPMRELGAHAALALKNRLEGRASGDGRPPHTEVLPSRLVVRASCGRH